jgi:ABC-2 type transport system permease protein
MLTRVKMIIWKEFIQIFRDVRTLGVVIIMPLMMLVIYGYAINLDVKHLRLGVLDQNASQVSRDLIGTFSHGEYFDIIAYLHSHPEVNAALDRGRAQAVLVIPPTFTRDLASGRTGEVQLLVDGSDSTTASTAIGYAEAILQQYSAKVSLAALSRAGLNITAANPIDLRPRVWYNPELKSVNFIVPGLIAVILMMLAALLTSMTIVRERERGTIEQLVVSPVLPHELIVGKLIPYVIIAFCDILLVIVAGRLIFQVPLVGSPILLMLFCGIFLAAALGLGLLISVLSSSQQTAQTLALLTTLLPSFLLSGFIFPISSMPAALRLLTNIIPARHFIVILRGIFLKGDGLAQLWRAGLVLLVFGLLVLGLSVRRFKKKL